jgi:hypothetical protein
MLPGVVMPVAGRNPERDRKVGRDLPEGEQRDPLLLFENVVTRRFGEPVGLVVQQGGAPPHDRIRWVQDVERAMTVLPGLVARFCRLLGDVGEADDASVLVHRVDLGRARIPSTDEIAEEDVEVWRADEERT